MLSYEPEGKQHFFFVEADSQILWKRIRQIPSLTLALTHTQTEDRKFSAFPFLLLLFVVQFRASVIVVCILYFDKTFIYEKPRQWKHYRALRPPGAARARRRHTAHHHTTRPDGDEKGVLKFFVLSLFCYYFPFVTQSNCRMLGRWKPHPRELNSAMAEWRI